jgi:sensor c-di-GMP phosphodiesterase-like protein
VHYQPVVSLTSGVVVGCEALLRIVGTHGVPRSPTATEILQLESSYQSADALMNTIFRCLDRDLLPVLRAYPSIYVSVNTPAIVLGSPRAASILDEFEIMRRHRSQVVIEITERQTLTEEGRRALQLARELGLRVAVDDFGTGESGLKQLLGLNFDMLKIHGENTAALLQSVPAERLLRGIVALAGALRVAVIAEGVEQPEQALFLRAVGVDYGQGWYWSKAVPATELAEIVGRALRKGQKCRRPAWSRFSIQATGRA